MPQIYLLKMVYELSIRKLKREAERLEELSRENLYSHDLEGFVFDSADSLYHRTCMLAKKIKVPSIESYVVRAENSYECAKNMRTNNKITAIYGLIWATSELEKAIMLYIKKEEKINHDNRKNKTKEKSLRR